MRWLLLLAATTALAAGGAIYAALGSNADLQASTAASARAKLDALGAQWDKTRQPPAARVAVLLVVDDLDEAPLRVEEGLAASLRGAWRRSMTLDRRDPEAFLLPEALPVRAEALVREGDARAQVDALVNILRTAKAYQARTAVVARGAAALSRAFDASAAVAQEGAAPGKFVALGVPRESLPAGAPAAPEGFVVARRPRIGEPVVELRDAAGAWQPAPPTTFAGDDPLAAAVTLAAQPEPIKLYAQAVSTAPVVRAAPPKPAEGPTAADLAPHPRPLKGKWKGWLDWSGHRGEFALDLSTGDAGHADGTLVLAGPGGTQNAAVGVDADITGGFVTETLPVNPRMKCQGQLLQADRRVDGVCWSPDGVTRKFRLDRQ